MRWCCFSLIVMFGLGYTLGAMTEPPAPRQSVICTIVDWIQWFRGVRKQENDNVPIVPPPRPFRAVEPDVTDSHPRVDHYGSL